jgi:alpha-tubulin suppressor-like RCC1 family protein
MGGILLLSGCGEEDSDPTFTFTRTFTPDARLNGDSVSVLAFETDLALRYELVAGDGRACAYGKRSAFQGSSYLSCWGRRIHPNDREQVSGNVDGSDKMLSIGNDHVCTTLTNLGGRRVHCDGSNNFGVNTDPEPLGESEPKSGHWLSAPYVIASGDNHNCALDAFGVYCWGDNRMGQTVVPVLTDPRWVAAGGNTSCAIDDQNELICWGDNSQGQASVPGGLTDVSKVAVGHDFVCASDILGEVSCWGNTLGWSASALAAVSRKVVHMSAGKNHVCILNETQAKTDVQPQLLSAECFGQNNTDGTLLDVPADINLNIRTISAGNGFTCASNEYSGYAWSPDEGDNGDVIYDSEDNAVYSEENHQGILCWGSNDQGQASAPKQLCLGYHSKAIDFDERTCPE